MRATATGRTPNPTTAGRGLTTEVNELMRILVFGAGVLGSLYAARLHGAGHDVTLFARGDRLTTLTANGVQLEQAMTGVKETVRVPVTGVLAAENAYDLVRVFVRGDQLAAAARSLPSIGRAEASCSW